MRLFTGIFSSSGVSKRRLSSARVMRGTFGMRRDGYTGYSCLNVVGPKDGYHTLVGDGFWKTLIRGNRTETYQSAVMLRY